MTIISRLSNLFKAKKRPLDPAAEAERVRQHGMLHGQPDQAAEQARVREHMEAELDAQRERREQAARPQA